MAGSSITLSDPVILDRGTSLNNSNMIELEVAFVADSANGAFPTLAVTEYDSWYVHRMAWVPGAVAPPTDLTDLTLPDTDGLDVLDGAGLNLPAASNKEENMTRLIPSGGVTVTLVQPAVKTNSATATVRLTLVR